MSETVGGQEIVVVPVRDLTREQRDVYDQRLAGVLRQGDGQVVRVGENYMSVVDGQSGQVKRVFDPEKDPKNPEVCSRASGGFEMVSRAVDRAGGKPGKLEDGWQRDLAPTVKAGYGDLVVDGVSGQEEMAFVYNKALRRLSEVSYSAQELFPSLAGVFGEDLEEAVNYYNRVLGNTSSDDIRNLDHRKGFVDFKQGVNSLYQHQPERSRKRRDVDEGNRQILDNLLGKIRGLFQDIARERGLAV